MIYRDISETLGDTWTMTLTFQDPTGVAESHAGSTWRCQVKTVGTSASTVAAFTVDTTNAATGIIVATIAAATLLAAVTVDTLYVWDIEETASGGAVTTHIGGTVRWTQDVSRA
jgi:hypothetical protein